MLENNIFSSSFYSGIYSSTSLLNSRTITGSPESLRPFIELDALHDAYLSNNTKSMGKIRENIDIIKMLSIFREALKEEDKSLIKALLSKIDILSFFMKKDCLLLLQEEKISFKPILEQVKRLFPEAFIESC